MEDEELVKVLLANVSSDTLDTIKDELGAKLDSTSDIRERMGILRNLMLTSDEKMRRIYPNWEIGTP